MAASRDLLAILLAAGDDYEIVAAVPETSAPAFEAEAANKGVERHGYRPAHRKRRGPGAAVQTENRWRWTAPDMPISRP